MASSVSRYAAGVILASLLLAAVEVSGATLRIIWRAAVLSWDSPATQLADELAGRFSPLSDAGADARQSTRLACRPTGQLTRHHAPPPAADPELGAGITRSPPAS
jgi:hypothetical protein